MPHLSQNLSRQEEGSPPQQNLSLSDFVNALRNVPDPSTNHLHGHCSIQPTQGTESASAEPQQTAANWAGFGGASLANGSQAGIWEAIFGQRHTAFGNASHHRVFVPEEIAHAYPDARELAQNLEQVAPHPATSVPNGHIVEQAQSLKRGYKRSHLAKNLYWEHADTQTPKVDACNVAGTKRSKCESLDTFYWEPMWNLPVALPQELFFHDPKEAGHSPEAVVAILTEHLQTSTCTKVRREGRLTESLVSNEEVTPVPRLRTMATNGVTPKRARSKGGKLRPPGPQRPDQLQKLGVRGREMGSAEISTSFQANDFLIFTESVSIPGIDQPQTPSQLVQLTQTVMMPSARASASQPTPPCQEVENVGRRAETPASDAIGSAPMSMAMVAALRRGQSSTVPVNKVEVKKSSKTAPSRFCHICTRSSKSTRFAKCCHVETGTCRKIICERCAREHRWGDVIRAIEEPAFAATWSCLHCRGACPSRAQCATYKRVNSRRRQRRQVGAASASASTGRGGTAPQALASEEAAGEIPFEGDVLKTVADLPDGAERNGDILEELRLLGLRG